MMIRARLLPLALLLLSIPAWTATIQQRQIVDYAVRNVGDDIESATAYLTINATTPETGAAAFTIKKNSTNYLTVKADTGYIGVGTTSPLVQLDVRGRLYLNDGSAGSPAVSFNADTNTGFYRQSADLISFVANGQNALNVSGTSGVGRLMIGNGSPVSRLQINDDNNNTASGITLGGNGSTYVQLYKSNSNELTIADNTIVSGDFKATTLTAGAASVDAARLVHAKKNSVTGTTYGGHFEINGSSSMIGDIYGLKASTTGGTVIGAAYGGYFLSDANAADAYGVVGLAASGSGKAGVYGADGSAPVSIPGSWAGYFKGKVYADDNVGIGTTTFGTSAVKVLAIKTGTPPSSSPADLVQLYVEDVTSSAELKVRDEAGYVTCLSPHNFTLFEPDSPDGMAWSYYSKNPYLGREINVDMYRALKTLEQLSGEQFVHTRDIPREDWSDKWTLDAQPEQVEVPREEAFDEYPEEIEIDTGETRTAYRLIESEGTVVPVEVPVIRREATGRMLKRLKPGVQFDEQTGTFYRVLKAAPEHIRPFLSTVIETESTQSSESGAYREPAADTDTQTRTEVRERRETIVLPSRERSRTTTTR